MSKKSMKSKSVKITSKIRKLYARRDRSLDRADVPQLSPAQWAKAEIGRFYRPIKTQISLRIDADVLAWLKSKGEGHLGRINTILRERMTAEGKRGG